MRGAVTLRLPQSVAALVHELARARQCCCSRAVHVYVATEPGCLRKSFEGLAAWKKLSEVEEAVRGREPARHRPRDPAAEESSRL